MNFRSDIVMVSRNICIFIDGCFWHKCPRCYKEPKSNRGYWVPKINRNVQRDLEQNEYLNNNGWAVIRIWEHEIKKNLKDVIKKMEKIIDYVYMIN